MTSSECPWPDLRLSSAELYLPRFAVLDSRWPGQAAASGAPPVFLHWPLSEDGHNVSDQSWKLMEFISTFRQIRLKQFNTK